MRDRPFYVALSAAAGIGPARFRLLTSHFKTAEKVWYLPEKDLREILGQKISDSFLAFRKVTDPIKFVEDIERRGIKILLDFDKDYPKLLKEIDNYPPVIFFEGELKSFVRTIAVVGSRKVTSYGKDVTEKFVTDLVKNGFTIVSGLARGVDSIAAKTALKEGGRTVAVLGGGLSRIYPPENIPLAKEITRSGTLFSEYAPDITSTPGNFPARNRIISGLSLGVLVTEAGEESGSLITAGLAAEQGRDVFAVPGPIYSKLAHGPAKLIKEGAKLVISVEDILEELNLGKGSYSKRENFEIKGDTPEEQVLIDLLINEPSHVDQLIVKSNLTSSRVSSLLSILELKGKIRSLGNGNFSLKI